MSNELTVFKFNQADVRTVLIDNEPWFVGKDICEVLGYSNPNKTMDDHCRGVTKRYPIADSLGRQQDTRVIPESDLYRLIIKSNMPEAIKFEKWVMEEVLPTIRKTGSYSVPTGSELLALAVLEANRMIEEKNKQLAVMAPKAEFYDTVTQSNDCIDMAEVSKILGISKLGRNKLFEVLRDKKILMENNQPYQKYVDAGYFKVIENTYTTPAGSVKVTKKTVVFQKGLDYIRKLLK